MSTGTLVSALGGVVGAQHVREATAEDAVMGVQPSCVVEPADEVEVAAVLACCTRDGLAVVVRGGGTKLDCGEPPRRCDAVLSMRRLDGLVEHEPGDMVCVVQPGMRVDALAARVGEHRQRLMAGAVPSQLATIGGVVAANAWGCERSRFGTARDMVIGARFVLADGTVGHSGGKVVKNVAGYDVAKLLVGSLGTLAVITELSLRLQPQPLARRSLRMAGLTAPRAAELTQALVTLPVVLGRCDLWWPSGELLVEVEGTEDGVARQAEAVAALGAERAPDGWQAPTIWDAEPECVATLAVPRTSLRALLDTLSFPAHVLPTLGVAHVDLSGASADAVATLRGAVESLGGHLVLVRTPAHLHGATWPARDGVDVDLMRSLKRSLDPAGTLAPGRFLGGI